MSWVHTQFTEMTYCHQCSVQGEQAGFWFWLNSDYDEEIVNVAILMDLFCDDVDDD